MKSASAAKQATKRNENSHAELVLPGPRVPEPMFFCTIEPESAAYQKGEHTHRLTL